MRALVAQQSVQMIKLMLLMQSSGIARMHVYVFRLESPAKLHPSAE